MIIEFELQGSRTLHKGIFDTTGFWVKYEEEGEHVLNDVGEPVWRIDGYKIFSHISFSFYHTDKSATDLVYGKLVSVLRGAMSADIEGFGYIRRLNK
jgi:hypothetical protein